MVRSKAQPAASAFIFSAPTKHQGITFAPDVPTSFEDGDVGTYFVRAGWASETDQSPRMHYTADQISFDPATRLHPGTMEVDDVNSGSDS